jgi:hypothetical protein
MHPKVVKTARPDALQTLTREVRVLGEEVDRARSKQCDDDAVDEGEVVAGEDDRAAPRNVVPARTIGR